MDSNSWSATQGQAQIPCQDTGGDAAPSAAIESGDWRTQLQPDSRQRIVNKIMDTLKRRIPFSEPEGLQELEKIAVRFEEKIYTSAISQQDYLRKISLKMLTVETKSQNPMPNCVQANAASNSKANAPQDPGSQSMQSLMQNQEQLSNPLVPNQSQDRQQLLSQNIQNNISSTRVPNSSGLTSAIPSVGGITSQNPNMQSMPDIAGNAVGTSMGQSTSSIVYPNSQRPQIQGRQLVMTQEPQQQQQPQNSQQYLYNQQQLHQHLMKQKFQPGNAQQQPMMQAQMQQQPQHNLPQQNPNTCEALMQPPLRQTSASSTIQNQPTPLQQSTQSMLQQQSQTVRRKLQQQSQQPSIMNQPQNLMLQHAMMPTQQQQQQQQQQQHQHLSMQLPNKANMQPNQLIGQQNNILDAQLAQQHQQQQRMISQQNNMSNMQQQQTLGHPNNLQGMHQQQSTGQQNNLLNMQQQQSGPQNNFTSFQQQQMVGNQQGTSSLQSNQQPVHMLQQPKVAVQQHMQSNMSNMLPSHAQQLQSQPMQLSQIQAQPGQQQLGQQQQANTLKRDMQQRIQTSGSLHSQQTTIDQQKQLLQSQRVIPEVPLTTLDSSPQSGNPNGGDWQEETYQKIKSMNGMYLLELSDIYQRMAAKLQQFDSLQQPKNAHLEQFRSLKIMLERCIMFLRTNKNGIQHHHRDKIAGVERQIVNILNSTRARKPASSLQQGQLTQPPMHAMHLSQQQQSQISQMHANKHHLNSHMQPNVAIQQNNLTALQSVSSVPNSRQNMMDAQQPCSSIDSGQGNTLNPMHQVSVSSLQQNPGGGAQQMIINSMSPQNALANLQSNVRLQANGSILQPNQIKQEQQIFASQQLKQQCQQRQMEQHLHRQQLVQQQQQQSSQQQSVQLSGQQMMQLNHINDANEMKMRHQLAGKSGVLQPYSSSGQLQSYDHQQLKSGTSFSISSQSQQVLQATSLQIGHQPSLQIDQQNILPPHSQGGTPLHSANSPFIAPSPSTSMAPSPMPGDYEKVTSGPSLFNAGNSVQHLATTMSIPNQSVDIATPGISASPLLAEFTSSEGTHGVASTIVLGNCNVVEQPLERLFKVIKSMSPKALSASVSDISSVVSMVDRIAGSAPGNGSRTAVGDDLVAMTQCRLQARNFFTQDGPTGSKKMRRFTSAMPSSVVSSSGSVTDNLKHFTSNDSDGESTGASRAKRPRIKANHALEEELWEINQRLIDTIVYISDDDIDPIAADAASASAEAGEGTIVMCSFTPVGYSPSLKSHYGAIQLSAIQPLRLLIPNNYPSCSPVLLNKFPVEVSKEYEALSIKVNSRFCISLRSLAQPMSLGAIARIWDSCARAVISEYAQQSGGGSFSSKYGTWESCLSPS